MIKIKANLFLKKYLGTEGQKEIEVPLKEGYDVKALLFDLGIPEEEVGMIIVNGSWKDSNYIIRDGDTIEIYPHFLGG